MARILIIDDDVSITTSMKMVLGLSGFEVTIANDGRRGMQAAEADAFDLLIVDIFMPGMDGFETIRAFRQIHPSTPILLMSGSVFRGTHGAKPDFLAMAGKLSAAHRLYKPFAPQELLGAVRSCLGRADEAVASGRQ